MSCTPSVILTDGFQYKKVVFGTQKLSCRVIVILSDIYCTAAVSSSPYLIADVAVINVAVVAIIRH